MRKVDISIVIVSYNTAELTIKCIESVINTVKKVAYEIIVVDNASSDGSIAKIKKIFDFAQDKITVIQNSENVGFSKANNSGVRKSVGRYVLFLNSDTVVYEHTIDQMVELMDKNKKVGAATCYVELPNGKLDDAAHRGFPTPWRALSHFSGLSKLFRTSRMFSGYSLGALDLSKTHEIEALAGAFMLVRRDAGREVGWWDEDFFWYGEDLDFCYRLKQKEWKIYFVPEYKILHYKGASGGLKKISRHISTANPETRKRAHQARFHAMRLFYHKHYRNKYPAIFNWLVLAGIKTKELISRR